MILLSFSSSSVRLFIIFHQFFKFWQCIYDGFIRNAVCQSHIARACKRASRNDQQMVFFCFLASKRAMPKVALPSKTWWDEEQYYPFNNHRFPRKNAAIFNLYSHSNSIFSNRYPAIQRQFPLCHLHLSTQR